MHVQHSKVRKNNVGGYTKLSITREREMTLTRCFLHMVRSKLGDQKEFLQVVVGEYQNSGQLMTHIIPQKVS